MIEFQYFEGCPNSVGTLANIKALIRDGFINKEEVKIVEATDPDSAEELNFQGSPTILVNGIDIYTERTPANYSYSCRIYDIDNCKTGVLTKEYIRDKIQKLAGRMHLRVIG